MYNIRQVVQFGVETLSSKTSILRRISMNSENMISEEKKNEIINILTEELPSLRAKLAITQEELCGIVGISRQTYSSIETKKRKMSWNVFLSLIMFFTNNEKTVPVIELIGAFPDELKESLNISNR